MRPFAPIFVPDELESALSDEAWLRALLAFERALALAGARVGVVPAVAADAIVSACETARLDPAQLARDGRAAGNPAEPLVRALRELAGVHGEYVHRGATSQDAVDTAAVLVARGALALVGRDERAVADVCASLADEHRATVTAARTLLQQAVPTTFGLVAAGWLVGVVTAARRLEEVAGSLPAQLGGAAGTLAVFADRGPAVVRVLAGELGLREPVAPWHTMRAPFVELAGALAETAAAHAKIAKDVALLAQTEVGELAESNPGGSSTMPQKENPVGAVLALACERHARANVAIVLESAVHEHQRAAGAWHAEWSALGGALAATGGTVAGVRRSLNGLRVHTARMRENVGAATLAEAASFGIAVSDPAEYLGAADAFVERALTFHRRG